MLRNIPNRCFRPTVDNAPSKEYRILDPQTPRISAQFPIVLQPVALQAEKITTSVQNLCQDIPMMASCICNWRLQLLLKPIPIFWPKNLANNPIKSPFWISHRTKDTKCFLYLLRPVARCVQWALGSSTILLSVVSQPSGQISDRRSTTVTVMLSFEPLSRAALMSTLAATLEAVSGAAPRSLAR